MFTDLTLKSRLLGGIAVLSLAAGAAVAETATDSSRAASDEGAVQTEGDAGASVKVESGVNEEAEEATSDSSRAASDDGAVQTDGDQAETGVTTDTDPGAAQGPKASTEMGEGSIAAMMVGDLIGKNVLSATGDDVGEIDYVIKQGGKVSGVIGVGGFLGMGEHTVAIPLEDFEMTENGQLQLTAQTEEQLKAMPEVDESSLEPLDDDIVIGDQM
ncbi:PRC-barrel domain-containing protein [Roseobacteraceae bacterium NS-SX3]